jgi:hypothetical protein
MRMIPVGLSASLAPIQAGLQDLLGDDFQVGDDTLARSGVVVLDEAGSVLIARARARSADLGIIAVLDEQDGGDPRTIVGLIESGADVCLAAPGTAGLAAHIRALAAHRPKTDLADRPVPA